MCFVYVTTREWWWVCTGYMWSLLVQRKCYPAPFSIHRFTRLGKTSVGRAWFPALCAQSAGIHRISRNLSPQEVRAAFQGGLRNKCHEPTPDGSNGDPGLLGSVATRSFSRSWSTSWVRGVIGLYLPQKKRPTLRANDSCFCLALSMQFQTSTWNATWLILPVVICLSQRLSHACVSMN